MPEIVPSTVRRSTITSHSIGVPELGILLNHVAPDAPAAAYRSAIVVENVLGLATESGRVWRHKTLRRIYYLRPDSILFRALRDLWDDDRDAHPLLAGLCALATDTVFRETARVILETRPGDDVAKADFVALVEDRFPGVYAQSSIDTIANKAYVSWEQTGHLTTASAGSKVRTRAICQPANLAYALLLEERCLSAEVESFARLGSNSSGLETRPSLQPFAKWYRSRATCTSASSLTIMPR